MVVRFRHGPDGAVVAATIAYSQKSVAVEPDVAAACVARAAMLRVGDGRVPVRTVSVSRRSISLEVLLSYSIEPEDGAVYFRAIYKALARIVHDENRRARATRATRDFIRAMATA